MDGFNKTYEYLPIPLKKIFKAFAGRLPIMEIRLRTDRPM